MSSFSRWQLFLLRRYLLPHIIIGVVTASITLTPTQIASLYPFSAPAIFAYIRATQTERKDKIPSLLQCLFKRRIIRLQIKKALLNRIDFPIRELIYSHFRIQTIGLWLASTVGIRAGPWIGNQWSSLQSH